MWAELASSCLRRSIQSQQRQPVPSTLSCQDEQRSALNTVPMVLCCRRFWRACASDRAADWNKDMDRRRRDRYAPRLSGAECAGADGARTATLFRPCVCVSRAARRYHQASVVRWRWPVPVRQAIRTWALHLATGYRRHGLADAGAALDAHGRHRLAQAAENLDAADGSISDTRDSPVSMRLLWIFPLYFCAILLALLLLLCRTLVNLGAKPRSRLSWSSISSNANHIPPIRRRSPHSTK